jgi:site-specific recombinase XerD
VSPFASEPVTNPRLSLVVTPTGEVAPIICLVDGTVAAHIRWMRLRGLSPNTIRLRRTVLGLLAAYIGRPLLDATPEELDQWQSTLGFLSVQTRNKYLSQVRNFYAWAVEFRHLEVDPTPLLVLPRVPKGLPRPISEQHLEQVLSLAPPRLRVWFELAAFEGARAGEVAQIDRQDVGTGEPPMLLLHGKGSKDRMVPLSPVVARSLADPALPSRGRLFRKLDGTPVSAHYVSTTANGWLHAHGFSETFHQGRHRFGTLLYRQTRDLRLVQELMGHEDPSTTALYTQVDPASAAPAVAAIDHPLLRPVQDTAS